MTVKPNTEAYEREILVHPSGFREYDARWLYPEQVNLRGMQHLGMALGALLRAELGQDNPAVVTGHDYRSYSATIKQALALGLMAAGCRVKDIGLALSPVAYFAQFDLGCPGVAMVTASHNENGWTGVKMGARPPLTFGPELMGRLKDLALGGAPVPHPGGSYEYVEGMTERYIADVAKGGPIARGLRAVVACGNGTAGLYAPKALEAIGCEVIPLDCEPDYTFPRHNPNPEDLAMLRALGEKVRDTGADIGFAFDGDGDRCGVVDDTGAEIFADKVGVILARDLAAAHETPVFVADVKSTGLFATDPVLKELGAKTDYWKTGHSYIKRRVHELGALAGFEKSGHFFFNAPIGRGYDDGILAAVAICRMLGRAGGKKMSDLYAALPRTWSSPTMSPECPDGEKYGVVETVTRHYRDLHERSGDVAGQKIASLVTINGVRVTLEDGTWGLVRASSNKPGLVVVAESPVSEDNMHAMFDDIDALLRAIPGVGAYDQKIRRAA